MLLKALLSRFLLFALFVCISFHSNSQEVLGRVLDFKTEEPIEGASVYFDNTTKGTTTDDTGYFTILHDPKITTPLIISFLGFKTVVLDQYDVEKPMTVYLKEQEDVLDQVVVVVELEWTRDEMLREFRKHYLGESKNGKTCIILNEDDLKFRYNKKKKQLLASSKAPLTIMNPRLKYEITSLLERFEINYNFVSKNKNRLSVDYSFYSGSNLFRSIEETPSRTTLEERKKAYTGSVLHLMRTMANESLRENGFRVYVKNMLAIPKHYIDILPSENDNGVFVRISDPLIIVDNNGNKSSVESMVDEFYIDPFGNHTPPDGIRFWGYLGSLRMGDSVPLDYLTVNVENKTNH